MKRLVLMCMLIAALVVMDRAAGRAAEPKDLEKLRPQRYEVVPLPLEARALNNRRVVVGSLLTRQQAARWTAEGGLEPLAPTCDTCESRADAINEHGVIVGRSQDGAAVWLPGTGYTELLVPEDYFGCVAWGINDGGQIVGSCVVPPRQHAMVWYSPTSVGYSIHDSSEWRWSQAVAINGAGVIVGSALIQPFMFGDFRYVPVRWGPSGGVDLLDDLGGTYGEAVAVNDAGAIVGSLDRHAVKWRPDGTLVPLGGLPQSVGHWAHTINQHGVIGGGAEMASEVPLEHGWLWQNGRLVDVAETMFLPNGSHIVEVLDINDAGAMVGRDASGRSYLLIPTRQPHIPQPPAPPVR